ncbi:MAG: extracellular solute-binding protein [Deltaproteobacteria bacterium]|nr:extracellular solute-binding protein [Deltaproteobacteria bacterium]
MNVLLIALVAASCWMSSVFTFPAFSADSAALQKARKEAETKGFIFITSRDEIIAKAKKEGKVKIGSTLDPDTYRPMVESFKKKYPFIEAQMEELSGAVYGEKFLMELDAGKTTDWDLVHAPEDFYSRFAENAMKLDLLGMAQYGVLAINPKMVDPNYRGVVSVGSALCGAVYNRELIPPEKVPNKWEDFLKQEFKGRKFLVDIRPYCNAALVSTLGDEWVKNYAGKLKDQQPVWARGQTRSLATIVAGENPMHQLANYHSCVRAQQKDPRKVLVCKVIEPVPVRLQENDFVMKTAPHPYAALLFLEHQVSPEGQKILDEVEPVKSSIYTDGEVARLIKGKKIALNDFKTYKDGARRMKMILEAFGFPKAELK